MSSVMPQAKRLRTEDNYQKTPPSHVVHARNLAEMAREPHIVEALQRYGQITSVIVMPKKRQALIEFNDISSAINCVNDSARSQIFICGQQAYLNYSSHQKIVKQQGKDGQDQNNVLLFNIMNAQYPITVDVMHKICSPYGSVLRIVILKKNGVQAMVEFENVKSATEAKDELQGADIYTDCCTIHVEYSKITKLNVFKNDQYSWDYTEDKTGSRPATESRPSVSSATTTNGTASYRTAQQQQQQQPSSTSSQASNKNGSAASNQLILMINNLELKNFNCDRLFNLLCLYGNVDRIKFLLTKEGSAMSQMNSAEPLINVLPVLNNTIIFGKKIHIHKSNQDELKPVSKPGELPDGTPSYKEYSTNRNNRYQTIEAAQKNKPIGPTNVLYWFNTPPGFDEEQLSDLFVKCGARPPTKVKIFQKKSDKPSSSTGLAEWSNITDSTEALILTNHVEIEHPSSKFPYIFKLCFSAQPIGDAQQSQQGGDQTVLGQQANTPVYTTNGTTS